MKFRVVGIQQQPQVITVLLSKCGFFDSLIHVFNFQQLHRLTEKAVLQQGETHTLVPLQTTHKAIGLAEKVDAFRGQ